MGDGDGYKAYLAKGSKLIDAGQASVLPGFIDNHFHVVVTALSADWVSLEGVRNYSAMGRRIRAAKAANPGKLIIATRLDAGQLDEGDLPDRTILDKFCKDTPVAVYSVDYKVLILNTCGILYFKVPFTSAGVGIDEKGMPTGIFTGQAGARLDRNIFRTLPEADGCSAIQKLIPELFRYEMCIRDRFMNLLSVIDNKQQDVQLISVLHSEIFGFSADDLAKVRAEYKTGSFAGALRAFAEQGTDEELQSRCADVLSAISAWKAQAGTMPLGKFIWRLLLDTGYYMQMGAMPAGQQRQACLLYTSRCV